MLCLNPALPAESPLGLICQVALLTAYLLLSQEDASLGTLQSMWSATLIPVYPGNVAQEDHEL